MTTPAAWTASGRGIFLGDWRGYFGGFANVAGIKQACEGLYNHVSRLEQLMQQGMLTKADLGDINALRADLSAILEDYDTLSRQGGEDAKFRGQVVDWQRRVGYVFERAVF